MTSFELSKLQGVNPTRGLSENDRPRLDAGAKTTVRGAPSASGKPGVALEVGSAIDPSSPPVNADRVSQIRAALKDGTYPLMPAKIADAIIATRVGFGLDVQ